MPSDDMIKTTLFVLSDTHGERIPNNLLLKEPVDVAIHCGDLTDESKIEEFRLAVSMMEDIKATLKIMIAGNHDFSLDLPMFQKKIAEIQQPVELDLVEQAYGTPGQAQTLLRNAALANIHFLEEGQHDFVLDNGAHLKIFASPDTPSTNDWAFQYHPESKHWQIPSNVDIVVTHGPPKGIFDMSDGKRLGCPQLFEAIEKARPRMHCFGHVHSGWGGKLVTWKAPHLATPASHFTAIDNDRSLLVSSLQRLHPNRYDSEETKQEKLALHNRLQAQGYARCEHSIEAGEQTLFVNAAVLGTQEHPWQVPWVVDVDLPRAVQ